jgi:hypothetical protein
MFVLNEELAKDIQFIHDLAKFSEEHGYTIIAKNPEVKFDNTNRKAEFEILFKRDLISGEDYGT